MENATAAFLNAAQRSMVTIRKTAGAGIVDPAALSAVERHHHTRWLRREAENADILPLSAQGVAINEIMGRTDKLRGLVRQLVRGGRQDIFRIRMSSLDPFLAHLETAWAADSHNGAALWRTMKTKGFTGSLRVVTEWATTKRKGEGTATRHKPPNTTPSGRRIARMMTTERDTLSKVIARTIAMIGAAVPDLTTARDLLDRFHRMIQHRQAKRLNEWLADAKPGLMASFASGIAQDCAAVTAALNEAGRTVRPKVRTPN